MCNIYTLTYKLLHFFFTFQLEKSENEKRDALGQLQLYQSEGLARLSEDFILWNNLKRPATESPVTESQAKRQAKPIAAEGMNGNTFYPIDEIDELDPSKPVHGFKNDDLFENTKNPTPVDNSTESSEISNFGMDDDELGEFLADTCL